MEKLAEKPALFAAKTAKSLLDQRKSAENHSGEGCANTPSPWQNPDVEGLKMLAVKLPDETSPRKRGEWINPRVTYSREDLEFIRVHAPTMTDRQIAEAMGWTVVRVMGVRRTNNIPASQLTTWTPEKVAKLHELYIVQGLSSGVVGTMLECSASAVRIKTAKLGWVHDPKHVTRNKSNAARATAARRRNARPPAPVVQPVHREVPRTHALHLAPIVFAAPRAETEVLGDRILRELSAKPLSAASLATLLGEKEELVGRQLRVFDYEGVVVGGVVDGRGLRYRPWSLSSSVAQTAASLRCGPDSLVVAGEAA